MSLAWGGYSNGKIPIGALAAAPNFKPLPNQQATIANGSNFMRADAARQLSGMMQAFYQKFGTELWLSEGYRPMAVQDYYYNRYMKKLPGWTLAAFPGTSIHGWALSADLNVNGSNPSGAHLQWLRDNAHIWGFVNDVTTEPWHWSYRTDLVKQSITVQGIVPNPQSSDLAVPPNQGDEGVDRLIRNKKTGSIDWVNTATGFVWHIATPGYISLVSQIISRAVEDFEDNVHGFIIQMANEQLNRIAATAAQTVWSSVISTGWNGDQQAMGLIVGADKKAGTLDDATIKKLIAAIPAASGGDTTVNVNAQELATAISAALKPDLVKGVSDDIAARMKD